jgi:hypothetical protein
MGTCGPQSGSRDSIHSLHHLLLHFSSYNLQPNLLLLSSPYISLSICPKVAACWFYGISDLHAQGPVHNRGCHTSFFPFSIFREWGRGMLSLKGGGSIFEDWGFHSFPPWVKNGEWRKLLVRRFYRKASVFHMGSLLSPLEHKFLPHANSRVIPILHSLFSILHGPQRGVTLSPWRSYPIGSSFSSFSILQGGATNPNGVPSSAREVFGHSRSRS